MVQGIEIKVNMA